MSQKMTRWPSTRSKNRPADLAFRLVEQRSSDEGKSKEKNEREYSEARGRRSRVRYVAIYGRLSRDKSLYMRPHRGGPLYETPSGAPHGITLIPLWPTYTGEEKSLRSYVDRLHRR